MAKPQRGTVEVHPLTSQRWADMEELFGSAAIPGRCWCMWWRVTQKDAVANRGEGNRRALRARVEAGEVVGLLAYVEGVPAAWCSLGPRSGFGRIARSAALTPVEGAEPPQGTWSTVCYFVHRKYRHLGLGHALLRAATEQAAAAGAQAFEGYPVKPRDSRIDTPSAFPGTHSMYEKAGFTEVPSAAPDRSIQMIMRRSLP